MEKRKTLAAAALTGAIGAGALFGAALGNPLASGAQEDTTTTEAAPPADGEGREGREGRGHRGPFDLEAAAEAVGLSVEDLRAQLAEGKTLAEVAEAQGVERQALIDALVAAGEARLDEAKAELPERVAELIDRTLPTRGEGGPGGHGGRGGHLGRGPGFEAAAEALGLEADAVKEALRDGTTIADLAEQQGVDVQTVIDAMVAEAQERIAQAVENGRLTQEQADERLADITERITDVVNNGRPERGGPEGD